MIIIDEDIKNMDIPELQKCVHNTAKDKGWWDKERSPAEVICMIHSELSELVESLRDAEESLFVVDGKPQGYGIELADVIIRTMDLAEHLDVNLLDMIRIKMTFNRRRKYMHGKRF